VGRCPPWARREVSSGDRSRGEERAGGDGGRGKQEERTESYYQEGGARAARVAELFSRIAPRYDLVNDLQSFWLHRLWKKRLVRSAQVPERGAALDLCCGTGDIVRALAREYPGAAIAVGLDFAAPMLRIATGAASPDLVAAEQDGAGGGTSPNANAPASRGTDAAALSRPRRPRILFIRADALRVPFPDESFDCVTISYGLRNVADVRACISEARRVLRPGGRFLILEFGKPPGALVSRLYFAYLRAAVPLFGRLFFGDRAAYRYIHDSLVRFPSQSEVVDLVRAGGFGRVEVQSLLAGIMAIYVADVTG